VGGTTGDRQAHERHGDPGDRVDDVVVGGHDDRHGHDRPVPEREATEHGVAEDGEEAHRGQDRPAHVEAGDGGVHVRERRRVGQVVLTGHDGDCVGEAVEHPGWCHREQREDDEARGARGEERVAEPGVAVAVPHVEHDQRPGDERPEGPHVHGVADPHDGRVVEDDRLHAALPVEPQPALEGEDVVGVREGVGRAALGDGADGQVRGRRDGEQAELGRDAGAGRSVGAGRVHR
jgi:hypothetical protein